VTATAALPALAGPASATAIARLQHDYPGVQVQHTGDRLTRVFGTPVSFGSSPELSADAFVQANSDVFGLRPDELVPGNTFNGMYTQPLMYEPETASYKFTIVYYTQYTGGLPVYRAELRLLVLNVESYPVVWAGSSLRDLGGFAVPAGAGRNAAESSAQAAALREVPGLVNFSPADLVVWAGQDNLDASAAVALVFVGDNDQAATPEYAKWLFIADAATGRVLHREDQIVHTDVIGNVQGRATEGLPPAADACNPENPMPFKWARVSIGATNAYTNANGDYTIPNGGSSPVTVDSPIAGRWFMVQNQGGGNTVLHATVTPPGPANFMHNDTNSLEFNRAEVNGYVQANVVRDFVLSYNPSYPTIGTQQNFPVNVNLTSTCNAYYDGSSINFYRAGGGCNNMAFSSVIHHEYGHHLIQVAGSGQGEYGEGQSDVVGVIISDDPGLAYGFYAGQCTTPLRTADNNCQYLASGCSTCGSAIHSCGRLLSGCVWSIRNNLLASYPGTYLEILRPIAINSMMLHSGTAINNEIPVDYLTLDDDDGDISNGTPHYTEICNGFSAHGLTCPAVAQLGFLFPNGKPSLVVPAGGTTVRVEVYGVAGQPQADTGMFYYKIGNGSWTSTAMQVVAPNVYDAVFPAIACGAKVSYYFSARTTTNQLVYNPTDAPTSFYVAHAAYATVTVAGFDFEAATSEGWARDPNDTATTGHWNRDDPQGTAAQPEDDHTPAPGVKCWVTDHRAGSSIGEFDVDNGKTTLWSPVFNLAAYGNASVSYWRWYSNDQGSSPNADTFRVDISNNGGSTWTNAETVGPAGPQTGGGWWYYQFDITDKVPMSAQIRLRFIAEDAGSGSIIEAALDDFAIVVYDCNPPFTVGDMDCDGDVDFDDINPFVLALTDPLTYQAQYPNCNYLNGDCDGDGDVDFDDINAFVALLNP
jgi:hypothetical protein